MPTDAEFPKNHKVMGSIKMKMGDFTLYGIQNDLMPGLPQTIKFKSNTKPEEKNMSLYESMGLLLERIGTLVLQMEPV
jgi:hypothetical protein